MSEVVLFKADLSASERRLRGRTRLFDEAVERLRSAYEANVMRHEVETLSIKLEVVSDTRNEGGG